jgi:hypothetical protein
MGTPQRPAKQPDMSWYSPQRDTVVPETGRLQVRLSPAVLAAHGSVRPADHESSEGPALVSLLVQAVAGGAR